MLIETNLFLPDVVVDALYRRYPGCEGIEQVLDLLAHIEYCKQIELETYANRSISELSELSRVNQVKTKVQTEIDFNA